MTPQNRAGGSVAPPSAFRVGAPIVVDVDGIVVLGLPWPVDFRGAGDAGDLPDAVTGGRRRVSGCATTVSRRDVCLAGCTVRGGALARAWSLRCRSV